MTKRLRNVSLSKKIIYSSLIILWLEISVIVGASLTLTLNNASNNEKYVTVQNIDYSKKESLPENLSDLIHKLRYYSDTDWYYGTLINNELSGQYYKYKDEIHLNKYTDKFTVVHEYVHSLRKLFPLDYTGDLNEEELTDLIAYYMVINYLSNNGFEKDEINSFYLDWNKAWDIIKNKSYERDICQYYLDIETGVIFPKKDSTGLIYEVLTEYGRKGVKPNIQKK